MKTERETELEREVEHWKRVALHLADCHAATAEHEGALASTGKYRRERFANICRTAAAALSGERVDRIHGFIYSDGNGATERVKERLARAIEICGGKS